MPSATGFARAQSTRGNPRLLWLTIGLVGAVLFFKDHALTISQYALWTPWSAEGQTAAGGNLLKGLALSLVAAIGLYLLRRPDGRALRADNLLALLWIGCAAWCLASICWSSDAGRTARQSVAMIFFVIAALGIARQFTPRDLVTMALALSAGYVAVGVAAEMCLGTFRPWAGEYRFAGTLHPNSQGAQTAVLCLAAACALLAAEDRLRRRWLLALLAAGLAALLLTKSRTSCMALLAALAVVGWVRTSARRRLLVGLGIAAAAILLVLAGSLLGQFAQNRAVALVMLGREEQSAELTGRLPIWTELAGYARQRPWTGYGYESFWTPDRIDDISGEVEWPLREGHNQYLDAVLAVGLVGAAAILACVLVAAGRAARLLRETGDCGYAMILGLLVYGLFSAALESGKMGAGFESLLIGCGTAQLAFVAPCAASPLRKELATS
jgi:O-antigen ligase